VQTLWESVSDQVADVKNELGDEEGKGEDRKNKGAGLTKLQPGEENNEKEVSELRHAINDTIASHDRYKTIRKASIDSLPPSPLSRKNTNLLQKLV
jgi:hypothetical protein